ncbi:COG3014 family protein [Natronoflexus pectinivorans]|uniref:Tetratricopeptide repeat protein n=1 Tax=Natronoflexus pectinivorans TaxID=682526 RepID=A0A4R2GKA3_9BACT|nr:hypothetical protein [Natronoflexus pectinivorans]TCO09202.1 hypothetical protein EV194_103113 [Natronoflexus pectinivorans]
MKYLLMVNMLLILTGCATFYQRTAEVQTQIASGDFEQANRSLERNRRWAESNNHRVLFYMNRGLVLFMMGEHEESNRYFDKADFYIEDYRKNLATEALVLVSNPMARPYPPEDFESIMIHYYKALNFIALENYEGALVEARRVNIRLQEINDQYRNHKNRYARDAFAHNLMGLIYQANGDYNNAFIAYRNALEIYETDYTELFHLGPPLQLKEDLLYSARRMGFRNEVRYYEEKFGIKAPEPDSENGDLVFIWMNGLGPVKSEWSLNLSNMGTRNGMMILGSDELGVTFPIYLGNQSSQQRASLSNLSIIRVAFPKYVERPPLYHEASLLHQGERHRLEMAQNINRIAFQSLHDRMLREVGNNIMRLAAKQIMERTARNENRNLGTLVSIINAITERADTRNWQSLPYSLSYTRVSLPAGKNELILEQHRVGGGVSSENVSVNIQPGDTSFRVFHQLGTRP